MKCAFITGITGQDGSFLAELLLSKGYKVAGLVSGKHDIGDQNIRSFKHKLILETGDLLDKKSLEKIIIKHKPQEIYNLGGITFIPTSWEKPELTFNVNALAVARILELIRKHCPKTKFFQASSAKIFGRPKITPQNEQTPIDPLDPYSTSKAAAHFLVRNYRNHFSMFCCSGIMYNHESEKRGLEFVTRKITYGAARIKLNRQKELVLGDLKVKLDWGYAPDYVEAMYLMLQQKKADDYILSSGKLHSVEDVCRTAFSQLSLDWKKFVKTDKKYFRKEDVYQLWGDNSKAKKILKWQPKVSFEQMIKKMVEYDYKMLKDLSS
ncbi:hypothetical protein A3J78_00675 [Candidatus Beckwithbacteria bacterium RBG_13_35_6]|uniref:GDP-mannose 4,6-dehydratase n=1 Tax=Candidatus Beckwithbacteria bacterium RBG_13_35_6 TaxID=1797456 RepID=A0A1F5DBV2_9BACT|nr:MAG: hypothetical protein A3J78_00675 [Candidatus Beckwithbacteria bacterium RBG_13_35_6]